MAWSYRSDRADEIYASSGGPAAATTEQMPRPPAQGETTDDVLNPPEAEPQEKDKKLEDRPLSEIKGLPGITAGDLRVLEAQRQDPQAGPEVETPADRLARESKLVNQTTDLDKQRQLNEERSRIRMEERTRIQGEEREKELEKVRKEEAENAKKDLADEKKKADEEKANREKDAKKDAADAKKDEKKANVPVTPPKR